MNEFETVANELENKKLTNETSQEFAIEWIKGSTTATVTFPGGTRYASKVKKLAEEYPDDVKIRHINLDGSLVATLPVKFVKISSPRKISEEQRLAAGERLKKIREVNNNSLSVNAVN